MESLESKAVYLGISCWGWEQTLGEDLLPSCLACGFPKSNWFSTVVQHPVTKIDPWSDFCRAAVVLISPKKWILFLITLGRLELKEDNIECLLSTACILQLSQVVEACCKFLMKQLHPSNCLGIRSFADAQGCTDLHKVAHNYTMVCCLHVHL